MRKTLIVSAIIAVNVLLLSCSGTEKESDPAPTPTGPTSGKIDGSWHMSEWNLYTVIKNGPNIGQWDKRDSTYFKKGYWIETYTQPSTVTLNTIETPGETKTGTFEIKADSLYKPFMKNTSVTRRAFKVDSLTNSRMVIHYIGISSLGSVKWEFKYVR